MIRAAIAIVILSVVAAVAQAAMPMLPYAQQSGPMLPGFGGPMIPGNIGGGSPPPAGCSGAVDLSAGCALPMIRGL